jgi:RHS repeat-associated protein
MTVVYYSCFDTGTPPTHSLAISTTTNRVTGTPHAYDANGNMTHDGVNAGLVYDAENRLTAAAGAAFTFDSGPMRVKKVLGGVTTVYVYSGSKALAEYENGALKREYIYAGDRLLAAYDNGTLRYQHPDHLSTRLETNSAGAVVRASGHYPFGESWYDSASTLGTAKLKFTSYERDAESNLDYAIFRNDLARYGRFLQPDPLGGDISFPQSLNRYSY